MMGPGFNDAANAYVRGYCDREGLSLPMTFEGQLFDAPAIDPFEARIEMVWRRHGPYRQYRYPVLGPRPVPEFYVESAPWSAFWPPVRECSR